MVKGNAYLRRSRRSERVEINSGELNAAFNENPEADGRQRDRMTRPFSSRPGADYSKLR